MTKRHLIISLLLSIVSTSLVIILHVPLSSVEEQVTALKYRLRGPHEADTNIVIVYIDNAAIKDLGWPVRRNFYALMVKALTELHVKAIGIDVMFEEPSREYPEYDELFAATLSASQRVVLASYARALSPEPENMESGGLGQLFPRVTNVRQYGVEYHSPLELLRSGAAGIGHVNVADRLDVPPFFQSAAGVVPSFGVEVLRVTLGLERSDVAFDGSTVSLGKDIRFEVDHIGVVSLNFPGTIAGFKAYPFVEVLKSYDAARLDRTPSVPVASFKGKTILVSVVSGGGSGASVITPAGEHYPPIGLHATFLDNALHNRFMTHPGAVVHYGFCLLLGFLCVGVMLILRPSVGASVAIGISVLVCAASFMMFSSAAFVFPLVSPVLACVVGTVSAFVYKQRRAGAEVGTLQAEKQAITMRLRDKEAKVMQLENELLQLEATKSADRTAGLLEEIRKYKAEIHALASRADDMEEFTVDQDELISAGGFEGIVFDRAGSMKPVIDFVGKIAASDAPVLILGESGTGKELVARAIHKRSDRAGRPFIAVNCGALAENLLESELFGHEKGAFTGAVKDKPGRFELADGGTIFLDEIGEVSEGFQLKLLRVLQEGELERVGGTATLKVDVRVLAATNKDLREQIKLKRFREDVYYRLNVLSVNLPPLRERQEDLPLLIHHFMTREGAGMKISKNVMEALQSYPWGGNIRELESVIKRAVLLARAEQRTMVSLKDITEEVASSSQVTVAIEDQVLESLREKAFSRSSISDTADELGGLNRGTVAEYFRGQCLKAFVEHGFDLERAARHISLSADMETNDRVLKKLREYIANIADVVVTTVPWDETKPALKPKTKNLPQRYHLYVDQIAEAYYRGIWKRDG